MPGLRVVGKPVLRVEGTDKVAGRANYAADILFPDMLWGMALRSPYAHARIVNVDASRARAVRGVCSVIVGAELPSTLLIGRIMRDMPVLARDKVRFVGEKVAAVAAEDPDAAEEALSLIEIEYEEIPAVFHPSEAMQSGAPLVHESAAAYEGHWDPVPDVPNACAHFRFANGDLEAGFREAHEIFENTFRVHRMHQGYIEPHACVAKAHGSEGLEIWASNKNPYYLRSQLSKTFGIPEDKIVAHSVSIGGDFGGKGSPMDTPLAYLLSRETGRPVRMVMTYGEELMAGNPRHPGTITLRTGVRADGSLCAMSVRAIWDTGAYGALMPVPFINVMGTMEAASCYRVGAMNVESTTVYTNQVPSGHVRAPGSPPTVFAVESQLDIIAKALGMDPLEFRLRNVLGPGDQSPLGHAWKNIRAREVLECAAKEAGWGRPHRTIVTGRGIAMYERSTGTGESSASLILNKDGSFTLLAPIADAGQGASTAVLQIVAETLNVSPRRITVVLADTHALPFDAGTGHSRTTSTVGGAAWQVAQEMRSHLISVASRILEVSEEETTLTRERFHVKHDSSRSLSLHEVAARAVHENGDPMVFLTRYNAKNPEETSFAAQVAEVEVDTDTGQVRVVRVVTAHDTGTVINPIGHQGQIEGGLVQGMGFGLMEEILLSEGKPQTLHLGDYKLPNIRDIPQMKTILFEEPAGPTPYFGRGIGEISNSPTAGAIANAIADAVGVRVFDLPVTAEKVYRALKSRR